MNKYFNNINFKNNINKESKTNNPNQGFKNLEFAYSKFNKSMETSDFKNSPRRYIVEHSLLKELIKSSKENNYQDKEAFYQSKFNEIVQKLDDFGIKIES